MFPVESRVLISTRLSEMQLERQLERILVVVDSISQWRMGIKWLKGFLISNIEIDKVARIEGGVAPWLILTCASSSPPSSSLDFEYHRQKHAIAPQQAMQMTRLMIVRPAMSPAEKRWEGIVGNWVGTDVVLICTTVTDIDKTVAEVFFRAGLEDARSFENWPLLIADEMEFVIVDDIAVASAPGETGKCPSKVRKRGGSKDCSILSM